MACEVVMIGRDEESRIREAVESALTITDRVIFLDTGSRDRTATVAVAAGAEVHHSVEWVQGNLAPFHFGRARNEALQFARAEWVLSLDADERIVCPDRGELDKFLRVMADKGLRVLELELTMPAGSRPIGILCKRENVETVSRVPRLFIREGSKWEYRCHELIMPLGPLKWLDEDVCALRHLCRNGSQDSLKRNLELLAVQFAELSGYEDPGSAFIKTAMDTGDTLRALGKKLEAYGCYSAARDALKSDKGLGLWVRGIIFQRLAVLAFEIGLISKTLEFATEALRILPALKSCAMLAAAAAANLQAVEPMREWLAYARAITNPLKLESYKGLEADENEWIEKMMQKTC